MQKSYILEDKNISNILELKKLFDEKQSLMVWGAGFYLQMLLEELNILNIDYKSKIECIIVSNKEGNPEQINGILVKEFTELELKTGQSILLALGERFQGDIKKIIGNKSVELITIDFDMFYQKAYDDMKQILQSFIEKFPHNVSGLNKPQFIGKKVWTCWWQGEKSAPELVKACWESQRRNIPSEIELIIITEQNYKKYIELPEYILEKVKKGYISLTTLSDIIRASLLYRWGCVV